MRYSTTSRSQSPRFGASSPTFSEASSRMKRVYRVHSRLIRMNYMMASSSPATRRRRTTSYPVPSCSSRRSTNSLWILRPTRTTIKLGMICTSSSKCSMRSKRWSRRSRRITIQAMMMTMMRRRRLSPSLRISSRRVRSGSPSSCLRTTS